MEKLTAADPPETPVVLQTSSSMFSACVRVKGRVDLKGFSHRGQGCPLSMRCKYPVRGAEDGGRTLWCQLQVGAVILAPVSIKFTN